MTNETKTSTEQEVESAIEQLIKEPMDKIKEALAQFANVCYSAGFEDGQQWQTDNEVNRPLGH